MNWDQSLLSFNSVKQISGGKVESKILAFSTVYVLKKKTIPELRVFANRTNIVA